MKRLYINWVTVISRQQRDRTIKNSQSKMNNISSKKWSLWAVTLVGAIAFTSIIPPVTAQTNPPSSAQSAELAEAERLNQQIQQLYQQGKYSDAIPLATSR